LSLSTDPNKCKTLKLKKRYLKSFDQVHDIGNHHDNFEIETPPPGKIR
jgi:hypothetical protein